MDGFSLMFWLALAGGGYAFYPPFRKWVNTQLVQIAEKVKADSNPVEPEFPRTLVETMAWNEFKDENEGDPRIEKGWYALPQETRDEYVSKSVMAMVPEDVKKDLPPAAS